MAKRNTPERKAMLDARRKAQNKRTTVIMHEGLLTGRNGISRFIPAGRFKNVK